MSISFSLPHFVCVHLSLSPIGLFVCSIQRINLVFFLRACISLSPPPFVSVHLSLSPSFCLCASLSLSLPLILFLCISLSLSKEEHGSRQGVGPPHLRRVKSVVILGASSTTRTQSRTGMEAYRGCRHRLYAVPCHGVRHLNTSHSHP